ncbi:sigma-70 family RNA polymerase sigma factor [uncultured Maribacter sp.]|uniref:RNA polymerase sigma factor n=1 Tax=uncultured Maribacter sp. TaxID=431308 RepID=UPI0026297571|nr:sigma-70 family RNA polymerase sigma factor [uncultured Maribacter sp.]
MDKENHFVKIIQENQGLIFKISSIYTQCKSDQEDLYQDIVYQLWKSFGTFRKESKLSTWMYRVALNTALTKEKRRKRSGLKIPIEKVILKQSEAYNTEFEERLKILYHHIHHLNSLDKGLILLLLEGNKYDEIAEISGLTPSNVGTRISRIKNKLKSNISK